MPTSNVTSVPVNVVGSSVFGIYPKTNIEKTYNMFISSDEWLLNYAGYKKVLITGSGLQGRGIYASYRGGFMITVVGTSVYKVTTGLGTELLGALDTSRGAVSIAENLSRQICIVDGLKAYIYNYDTNQFAAQALTWNTTTIVTPNYVDFHNGFFLLASSPSSLNPQSWYAAAFATATTIAIALQDQFTLSTKPDSALAVLRIPGRGNNVIVIGATVAEIWTAVGGEENYRRVASTNINLGTVSVETIATSDDLVVYLAQNEDEAPVIIATNGSENKIISTDGISHLLEGLSRPDKSTGFIYKQNGHLFYHLTFYDAADNISLLYDFNTDKFFHVSDEKQDFYPARNTAFFNKKIYFISLNDNGIYEMSQELLTYKYDIDNTPGEIIPRIRVTKTIRKEDSSVFRANQFSFWLEQGVTGFFVGGSDTIFGKLITEAIGDTVISEDGLTLLSEEGLAFVNPDRPRVDLTISKNGNQSFSNIVSREMNSEGNYRNQINWHRLGQANEITFQLRFWGFQRFVANNAALELY